MDPASKYPFWKRLAHQFQARRDIPLRRKFFVGYDLYGNTYWEFTIDGNMQRLRRKLEPLEEKAFKADYLSTIPPQWLQWLRRTRNEPPSLQELMNDQIRQQRIKILAKQADHKWEVEKHRLEEDSRMKLEAELAKVDAENKKFEEEAAKVIAQNEAAEASERQDSEEKKPEEKNSDSETKEDPWAAAAPQDIQSAVIRPRK